jgi:hypothetical protein
MSHYHWYHIVFSLILYRDVIEPHTLTYIDTWTVYIYMRDDRARWVVEHISRDGIDFALLLRVQVFCLIDTRAAHNDKKEARSFCLSKRKKNPSKKEKFISSFISLQVR